METASETPLSLWHSGSKNDPRYRVNETLTPDASSACPRIAGLKSQRSRRAYLRRTRDSRIAGPPRSSTRLFRGSLQEPNDTDDRKGWNNAVIASMTPGKGSRFLEVATGHPFPG